MAVLLTGLWIGKGRTKRDQFMRIVMFRWELTDSVQPHLKFLRREDDDDSYIAAETGHIFSVL